MLPKKEYILYSNHTNNIPAAHPNNEMLVEYNLSYLTHVINHIIMIQLTR